MSDAELAGNFPKLRPGGGEEPTKPSPFGKLLETIGPPGRRASQPLENPGQLPGDRGLPLAQKPPRVINQEKVGSHRQSLKHPFPRGIEALSILNRAKPQRLLKPTGGTRAGHASFLGRGQFRRMPLGFDVLGSLLDRGERTTLRYGIDPGGDRVQIDIDARCQESFFVEDGDTLEALLEKRSPNFILAVGHPSQWFLETLHEPTEALQSFTSFGHPVGVGKLFLNPLLGNQNDLSFCIPRREEPPPPSDDILVRPAGRIVRVESQQDVQVVVHDGETTDRDREDPGQLFEPIFNPGPTIARSFLEQERAADTAVDTMIPATYRNIDELGSSGGHGVSPDGVYTMYYRPLLGVKITAPQKFQERSSARSEMVAYTEPRSPPC